MKRNFMNSKAKYYKDLKLLMTKINFEHQIKDEKPLEEVEIEQSQSVMCKICNEKVSAYKCPKCDMVYCSIDCYKKHNVNCTEEFYKDNVISELKATKTMEEDALKFRRNLKDVYDKLNQSSPDFDGSNSPLEKKKIEHYEDILNKINSNTLHMESDITPADWKDFNEFLSAKDKKQYGSLYYPFWLREEIPSVYLGDMNYYSTLSAIEMKSLKELELNDYVTYYDEEDKAKEDQNENEMDDKDYSFSDDEDTVEVKTITLNSKQESVNYNIINRSLYLKYQNLKELSLLTKAQPAQENIYQLIVIVYTTVYLFRLFNGEFHIENDIEVIEYMMHICPLLHDKTPFSFCSSFETATHYFISNIKQIEDKQINQTMKLVLADAMMLIENSKSFIFESLVRLYEILHKFGSKSNKSVKSKITSAKHKLLYLMSYFKSLQPDVYNNQLQASFEAYYTNHQSINQSIN